MKIGLIFVLVAILGYSTGLVVEVIAEGDDSKLQRLADTGQFDPSWIPFLLEADLYKFNNLKATASLEFLDLPKFVQIGEMQAEEKASIDHANVAFDIGVIKVIDEGQISLQNVVNMCIFHSPDEFDELCVVCQLLDDAGKIIGNGLVVEQRPYIPSEQIEISIFSVPEPELPTDPLTNDVQEVEGVRLVICDIRGCTPGFWKTHSELGPASFNAWPTTGFTTGQKYLTVFGISPDGFKIKFERETKTDPTLFEAANAQGGMINALARHSVAALLNASSDLVVYPFTVAEVIAIVQAVDFSDDTSIESAKNLLEEANELSCPIGADSPGVLQNPEFEEEPGEGGKGGKKK